AICHKKKAKRYCPGIRASICATCCGTEREVTVDCPFECVYLRESRKYDEEKAGPLPEFAFPEIEVGDPFLVEHEQLIGQIGYQLLRLARENPPTTDNDILEVLGKLVRTYQTLSSGIYYESLPEEAGQAHLFREVKKFLDERQEQERKQGSLTPLRETDLIGSLDFLHRLATVRSNHRPRGRAFIDFLRQTYPEPAAAKEEPRLIVP
ncbi:MAG: hypothetical protein HY648_02685, partial [Acidobacteria bacterium]|nr:hypothetical protein [Acidobacteriota bacterium]